MITIKYIIQSKRKNAPIYIYISAGRGKFFKRKTKEFINPEYWNAKKGTIKNLTALSEQERQDLNDTNAKLKRLQGYILKEYSNANSEITALWLEDCLDSFYYGKKSEKLNSLSAFLVYYQNEYLPSQKITRIRKQRFNNIIERLRDFLGSDLPKLKVKDINALRLNKFASYLENKGLCSNTTIERIILIKNILKHAQRLDIATANDLDDYRGKIAPTPTPYLTEKELQEIKRLELKDKDLIIARDWLFVGCYTGQRIGDFIRMDKEMIININGKRCISLTQEKTGANVVIPLHKEIKEILARYGGNFPPKYGESTNHATVMLNRYIKTLCKMAGINRMERGRKYDPKEKRYLHGTYPMHEIASSHICRRSFATNHYGKVPTPIIMSITGHKQEKVFLNYIGVDDSTLSTQILDYWNN